MADVTFTTSGALKKSSLRQGNERLVLNAIRQNPTLSRADIARITGLSPSTVTFIVERMLRQKLVCEERVNNHAQVGRRPTALRLRPEARVAVGVELNLTQARVTLANWTGEITKERSVPRHASPELFFNKIHDTIRTLTRAKAETEVLGVGVGLPGFSDRATGKVIAAENFNWTGIEAGRHLRKDLPFPFYYENSAKLRALAETWFSPNEGKALRDFVFVTMRGGLGTGIIIDGRVLQGAFSAAAEFGHTILYPEGRRCPCGNAGCWEQYASDLAVSRAYAERTKPRSGEEVDAEMVVQRARQGDQAAIGVLDETAGYIALGLVNVIMVFNPEAIILGDYVAAGWDLMQERIWNVLRARVPAYYLNGVRIFPSEYVANSSLKGCIALVLSNYFKSFGDGNPSAPGNSVIIH
jgi:predicted NBD/HSP70 family sugar kinase